MKNFKAWEIIEGFSSREKVLFRQFAGLEMVCREKYVIQLYDLLIASTEDTPDNPAIFSALYPGEQFNDSRIRYLKAQLFSLLKKYIFLQYPDMLFEDLAVFRLLREKKLLNLYRKEEQKCTTENNLQVPEKSMDYLHRYFRAFEWHNHNTKTNRIATEYLEQLNLNIDLFFIIEKLKLACTSHNLQRLYKVQVQTSLLEPVLVYVQSENLPEKHPLLAIYFHALQMLRTGEGGNFHRLKSLLLESGPSFPVDEIKDAWMLALNFCIQEINKGNSDFYKEALLFYEKGIENQMLIENGHLSPITYSNAVTVALRGKDYQSALLFMEQYQKNLQGEEQLEYYHFNLSKYYFETGNFEKVIELYYQSNIKEVLLHIQVRIIQIKAFYEKEEYEICSNLIDNLQQHLSRKDILAYHKENYRNICRMFRQLLTLNRFNQQSAQNFLKKAGHVSPLTERSWLVAKVEGWNSR